MASVNLKHIVCIVGDIVFVFYWNTIVPVVYIGLDREMANVQCEEIIVCVGFHTEAILGFIYTAKGNYFKHIADRVDYKVLLAIDIIVESVDTVTFEITKLTTIVYKHSIDTVNMFPKHFVLHHAH